MRRSDGSAARQLDLLDDEQHPIAEPSRLTRRRPDLRLLRRDVYAELARRRRRAQISARHAIEDRRA